MEIYLIEPNKSQWFQDLNKGRITLSSQSLRMTLVIAVPCRGSRWTGKIRSESKCQRGTCSLGDHLKSSTNSYTSSCNLCFQHVSVCTLVHMYVCMYACAYWGQILASGIFFSCSSSSILHWYLSLRLEYISSGRTDVWESSRNLSMLPQHWDYRYPWLCLVFTLVLGTELTSLCLHNKQFT